MKQATASEQTGNKRNTGLQRIKLDVSEADSIRKKKTYGRGKGNSEFIQPSSLLPARTCFCWALSASPQAGRPPPARSGGRSPLVTPSQPPCAPAPFQSPLVFHFHKLGVKLRWTEDTGFQLFYSWKGKSFRPKAKTFF